MIRRRGWLTTAASATVAVLSVAAVGLAGCGRSEVATARDVRVVATTTVLGDIVDEIVTCAGGTARTLMPVGADPHDFAPSSSDVTAMVRADLVVSNGLGLEEGLRDAIGNAANDGARIFEVAPKLDPIPFGGQEEGDHHEEGSRDPHVWLDAARMARAATLIAAELGRVTKDTATFQRCGKATADALTELDFEVRRTLQTVPADRRNLITDHQAFGYFAKAYDFEIAGVVIPGGSTLATPTSAEIARLVGVIQDKKVPAIFSNITDSTDLASAVAKEAGSQVKVVQLFVGSLGKRGSGAETYQAMMRTNATRIADALKG